MQLLLRFNKLHRALLASYFLSIAYCLIWIPWRSTSVFDKHRLITVIYSYVWRAPGCNCEYDNGIEPNMCLILLRVCAVSAIAGAALLLSELQPPTRSENEIQSRDS